VFWQRHQELPDWEKVIKNIERGEQKIQRQADIMQAIRTKLDRYKNPWQELKVGDCGVCGVCLLDLAVGAPAQFSPVHSRGQVQACMLPFLRPCIVRWLRNA
jgi:hypothetical protein